MKIVTRFICAVLCVVAAVGCQSKSFTISGNVSNEDGKSSVNFIEGILSLDDVIDSMPLDEEGNFAFSGEVETPYMAQISKSGSRTANSYRGIIFIEGGDIKVSINEKGQLISSGTKLNDRFYTIIEEFATNHESIQELPMEEQIVQFNLFVDKKIDENLDNPIGLFLLSQVAAKSQELNREEMLARLSAFTPKMQAGKDAMDIKEELERVAAVDFGAPFIELTLPDVNGEMLSLSSFVGEGKWVLIDFWATWCPPCMNEMPYLQQAYKKYKELGFEIFGVSLDGDLEPWKEACEEMPWINTSALETSVPNIYKLQGIPANFLISPEGKIDAKNLRGKNLLDELEKRLKK